MELTPGKKRGLELISDNNNIIIATAMDQRGSLGKMIHSFNSEISYEDGLSRFKEGISKVLGNESSSLLLDPEYGWSAADQLNKEIGLIMAYEKTGYDASDTGRLPNLVDDYAVQDLVEKGASALKLLVYYDNDEKESYQAIKKAFIKRVGDECRQNDLLFILEPVSYSSEGLDAKGEAFASKKPKIIEYFMKEFSKEEYGIDLLKVEVPVAIYNIEGYEQYDNYQPIFSKEKALELYKKCSTESSLPFIYLSGGVTNEQFIETLNFAKEAGSEFCGSLCGRAIWKDGVETFAKNDESAYYSWLNSTGRDNLLKVKEAILENATPWTKTIE